MRLRTITTATLILVATASPGIACSVPVFRYALEHWRPDPYVVFVFHSEDLTTDHQLVVDSMQPNAAHGISVANVRVKVVNIDADSDPVTQQIRKDHQSGKLPWMVVLSPPKWGPAQTTWQGELTAENAAMVMDSPARAQISKKLIDGDSVVWVLLECGRVLYALVGKGIAPDVIEEASQFLTGGCQCTVKAQNPGVDLIMNVDWDKVVIPTESLGKDLPPLAGFSGFGRPDNELDRKDAVVHADVTTSNSGVTEVKDAGESLAASAGMGMSVLFVLTMLAVVVVVATVYFIPRTN